MKRRMRAAIGAVVSLATTMACAGADDGPFRGRSAVASMHATSGHLASGAVTFTAVDGGVRVVAVLTGVPPGLHGFHVHEYGDCGSEDGTSAGDHWNPDGSRHGGRLDAVRHVGDLGNALADSDGVMSVDFVDATLTLRGPKSVLGKAVILHELEDDLVTQPSGAAGARISCGVVSALPRDAG